MSMEQKILNTIQENREALLELSTDLFEHPEIGLQEFESCKKISDFLRKRGFDIEENSL